MNEIIEIGGMIAALGTAVAAVIGLVIARGQLKSINDQIKIAVSNQKVESLKIVLEIETQMNSRKLEFDKASKQVRESRAVNASDEVMEILEDYFNSVKESYFNSMDRLCYCIDRKYIEDKDWRAEYRNLLKDTIDDYPDDFNAASPYKNLLKINQEWQTS